MKCPRRIPTALWNALLGKVWHATSPSGLEGIVRDGQIAVASDRHNAFSHHMKLVSLFDFGPTAFEHQGDFFGKTSSDHMYDWLNGTWPDRSPMAVWLEADVDEMGERYRNAGTLSPLAATKKFVPKRYADARRRPLPARFIHGLEAGHSGPLSVAMLTGALLIECRTCAILYRSERVDEDLVRRVREWMKDRNGEELGQSPP